MMTTNPIDQADTHAPDSPKRCSFVTLGCKVNQYETQALREILLGAGWTEVALGRECELCVINTCAVTGGATRKSRKHIYRAIRSNPAAAIAATGCLADADRDEIESIAGSAINRRQGRRLVRLLPRFAPRNDGNGLSIKTLDSENANPNCAARPFRYKLLICFYSRIQTR